MMPDYCVPVATCSAEKVGCAGRPEEKTQYRSGLNSVSLRSLLTCSTFLKRSPPANVLPDTKAMVDVRVRVVKVSTLQ